MFAAVDDIHHRHRQDMRGNPADIAIERQAACVGSCLCHRQADAQYRVGAQPALVGRTIQRDHHRIQLFLVFGIQIGQRILDLAVDGFNCLENALAQIFAAVAVAQLDRFIGAGRSAGRHRRTAEAAVLEQDVDLYRRIAATVQNLAGMKVDNCSHEKGSGTGKMMALALSRSPASCNPLHSFYRRFPP